MNKMNLKIKNLVKAWFFPQNNAIILSSEGDLIVCDMKNRKITHFPTDMECIEQLTIAEDISDFIYDLLSNFS